MAHEDVAEEAAAHPEEGDRQEAAELARQLVSALRDALSTQPSTPLSTYRVQFHQGFGFEDARRRVGYLQSLGVSHLYASPYLAAMPGSTHGYDVIDHQRLNPEVGTPNQHDALCQALADAGMGQVLDMVPNHMGIEKGGNALWQDVLENGPASIYAHYFDVDWEPVKAELKDKVLLPILGDQYGTVLENGELRLHFAKGAFFVRYWEYPLPVAPRQYAAVLSHRLDDLEMRLPATDQGLLEWLSILTALEHLPHRSHPEPHQRVERNREKEVIKRRLAALVQERQDLGDFIEENVALFNGRKGEPHSFDLLDKLLEGCSYRLAHWRVAGEEINYRRFFDINGLAALRVEAPEVFEEAHALPFRWLEEGKLTGLRIDHPDGLFDPTAYFLDLQERYVVGWARSRFLRGPPVNPNQRIEWPEVEAQVRACFRAEVTRQPDSPLRKALYVVVEKIQGGREHIPEDWAVHGTVGYRFANAVTGILTDRSSERALTQTYHRFIGHTHDFQELLYEKKKLVLKVSMSSELNVLARELNRISEMNRRTRDFTLNSLRRALSEFIALFPVYRTYVDGWRPEVDARDVRYIEEALARAKGRDASLNASLFDFLGDVLLRRYPDDATDAERAVMLRFAMKVQQITGPVMAKGLEDTTFYIYNRLTSLNEVGGEPEHYGLSPELFHLRNQERAELWPSAMLSTSTHDTKRSEDVRARITVLSEMPDAWRSRLRTWSRLNRRHKTRVGKWRWPIPNDEYLYYQTLLGAWPMGAALSDGELSSFKARLRDYMLKAVKEAKAITSWVNPEPRYDEAVLRFVDGTLDPLRNRVFFEDAQNFKRTLERPGQLNALAQVLLKLGSPGVADFYQGCEMWDLSLVDPDNRRPVDFDLREAALSALDAAATVDAPTLCRVLTEHLDDGRAKLYVVSRGLRLRSRQAALFRRGDYRPLDVSGPRAEHAVAFSRHQDGAAVVGVVPRLPVPLLAQGGCGTAFRGTTLHLPVELEKATLRDVFTQMRRVPSRDAGALTLDLGELFEHFPVVLLEKERG